MSLLQSSDWILTALIGAAAGLLIGAVYFTHLRRTADRYLQPDARFKAALSSIGRITCTVVCFGLLARYEALAAVTALAGFAIARQYCIRPSRLV